MPAANVKVTTSPDYRTISVNGVIGGAKVGFLDMIVFTEELDYTESLTFFDGPAERSSPSRTLQCRLVMDPFTAKIIHHWLGNQIAVYEREVGKIAMVGEEKPPPSHLDETS